MPPLAIVPWTMPSRLTCLYSLLTLNLVDQENLVEGIFHSDISSLSHREPCRFHLDLLECLLGKKAVLTPRALGWGDPHPSPGEAQLASHSAGLAHVWMKAPCTSQPTQLCSQVSPVPAIWFHEGPQPQLRSSQLRATKENELYLNHEVLWLPKQSS